MAALRRWSARLRRRDPRQGRRAGRRERVWPLLDGFFDTEKRRHDLRRSALQSAARRRPVPARRAAGSMRSTTIGTSSTASPPTTLHPRLAGRSAAHPEAERHALGDRQLPQHLPRRRALQDLGYWILNDIVWRKSNPMPNFRGTRFTNAHETLIWASQERGQPLHLQLPRDEGAQRRAADALRLGAPDLLGRRAGEGRRGHKAHPTQKPEACSTACCSPAPSPGDVVLDPFFGTGTTGAVARRLGRHWIGIEREKRYVKVARERIASTLPLDESAMRPWPSKRAQPRCRSARWSKPA
jgi:hypothetical protein